VPKNNQLLTSSSGKDTVCNGDRPSHHPEEEKFKKKCGPNEK
jgi:hypothetical protein